MSKKYWKYWFEKACSFFVSVKMILAAVTSTLLCFGFISGENYTTIMIAIISAYGAVKTAATIKKTPEYLGEE